MEAKASLIYSHRVSRSRKRTIRVHTYLEQIYIFLCETDLLQYFWYGNSGSNAHDVRSQAYSSARLN